MGRKSLTGWWWLEHISFFHIVSGNNHLTWLICIRGVKPPTSWDLFNTIQESRVGISEHLLWLTSIVNNSTNVGIAMPKTIPLITTNGWYKLSFIWVVHGIAISTLVVIFLEKNTILCYKYICWPSHACLVVSLNEHQIIFKPNLKRSNLKPRLKRPQTNPT